MVAGVGVQVAGAVIPRYRHSVQLRWQRRPASTLLIMRSVIWWNWAIFYCEKKCNLQQMDTVGCVLGFMENYCVMFSMFTEQKDNDGIR